MPQLADFKTGYEFTLQEGDPHTWRVTDVGTRTLIAIKLDFTTNCNYKGPPYSVTEHVFDEYDVDHIYAVNGVVSPEQQDFSDSVWVDVSPDS